MIALAAVVAQEEEGIGAGPIGLVILLLMIVATFLLIRNMNARIKRLPREFPDQTKPDPPQSDGPSPS